MWKEVRIQNSEFRKTEFPHSTFCILHSAFSRRSGVTILEVLFSILVTSVGLLGAIALFPVASAQARRARLNDAMAAAGRSAVHTFDTVGMRQPARWMGWPTPWMSASGTAFVSVGNNSGALPRGTSFCIDPRMVATPYNTSTSLLASQTSVFPYVATWNYNTALALRDPRMYRITLGNGLSLPLNPFMTQLYADRIFLLEDDLAFFRPGKDDVSKVSIFPNVPVAFGGKPLTNDRSLPAFQQFTILPSTAGSSPQTLGTRQTQGHLSWMATLVPKVDVYSLNSASPSDEYLLSIVVFIDRPADMQVGDPLHERVVDVQIQGDGSTGGEVLLHWTPPASVTDKQAADYMKVRPNDWIMLAANQYLTPTIAVPRFQWYRVTHCDHEPTFNSTGIPSPGYELYATLAGQDWNTSCVNPHMGLTATTAEATLVEGVAAVYEKTIRLDYGSSF